MATAFLRSEEQGEQKDPAAVTKNHQWELLNVWFKESLGCGVRWVFKCV